MKNSTRKTANTKAKKVIYLGLGLLATHLVLREFRKREATIHVVEKLPFNFNAATVPPFGIFVVQQHAGNEELIKHELVHWDQYQRMGLVPFYAEYVRSWLIHGYDLHPMEQQARVNESDYCKTHYRECVRTGTAKTVSNPNFAKLLT